MENAEIATTPTQTRQRKPAKPLFNPANGSEQGRGFRYNGNQRAWFKKFMEKRHKVEGDKIKVDRGVYTSLLINQGITFLTARKWLYEQHDMEIKVKARK